MPKSSSPITLGNLIDWAEASSAMTARQRARRLREVWMDSRKVRQDDVFLAVSTANDDGHRYVADALGKGAVAAIVAKKKLGLISGVPAERLIIVDDPVIAVQRMARAYRRQLGIVVVGITGSSGKTTTRSVITAVLRKRFEVGETQGNWNNHIGVPLSLLRFSSTQRVGILEMGANHIHEIHALSTTAEPDIGIITNIGYGHIGLFGSLDATTRAKFEIADGLNGDSAFLLLNGDDPRLVAAAQKRAIKTVFFGTSAHCTIQATDIALISERQVRFKVNGHEYSLAMPGRHFVYSALPAIFLGKHMGIDERTIAAALASIKPLATRGTVEHKKGSTFIVDYYNANPSSMESAILMTNDLARGREKIAIVGEMLELGSYAKRLHHDLGKQLALTGVSKVLAVGPHGLDVARGARRGGLPVSAILVAPTASDAIDAARQMITPGSVVLIKGSRGIHLETIYEAI